MGLRLRKSVRLMPGVRVNFSMRGASLSVGGRGARVNLSSRGVRTTVGIPGTGLSWSQTTRAPRTRAPSLRSIEAAARREEREQQKREAQALIEARQAELRALTEHWRQMPDVPSRNAFATACNERPFDASEEAPQAPDAGQAARALRHELRATARSALSRSRLRFLVLLPIGVGVLVGARDAATGVATALFGTCLAAALLALTRSAAVLVVARRRFPSAWPEHWKALERSHAERVRAFHERDEAARRAWTEAECRRIAALRLLLDGDPEAIDDAVCAELEALDFPFETFCSVGVRDAVSVMLAVDLPEIEDVIPETTERLLANGTVKETKRTRADRFGDYAQLVCGLALQLARAAFAAAPTLECVVVGGYTQRRQRGTGAIADEWVFDLQLERSIIERLDPASVDPVALVGRVPGRIDLRPTMELKRIDAPCWAEEFARKEA